MAGLAVQSSGGGTTSLTPASPASRASARRIAPLLATPPAATSVRGRPATASKARSPARVRSTTTSTTAAWNDAHRSATTVGVSGPARSASRRTAVFRPDKEKSAAARPSMGRGSAKRVGSPLTAWASTRGPPG